MALNPNRTKINISLIVVGFFLLLSVSSVALAQEIFSVKIPPQMDKVIVERGVVGQETSIDLLVLTEKDSNIRNPSFNRGIKALGIKGEISHCSLLVNIPGGENHSYGGFCSLELEGRRQDIVICNDNMVGHFALYHASVTIENKPGLIQFVVSNCFGG